MSYRHRTFRIPDRVSVDQGRDKKQRKKEHYQNDTPTQNAT